MRFQKYQALGNDYLVLDPTEGTELPGAAQIRLICDRHYGVGADGLLFGPLPASEAGFGLRLFNPDGGEFEKSGNGLRIFARYLLDRGLVGAEPFVLHTPGGPVTARIQEGGRRVTIDMGLCRFDSTAIPVAGPPREVLDEEMIIAGQSLRYSAATLGNPHCVLLRERVSAEEAQRLGPLVEREPRFPNRTNVQFVQVLDRSSIQIEIWERGVGYTLASGSSSCAAAAVAHRLGRCGAEVAVHQPGGVIDIRLAADGSVTMAGAVTHVCTGTMAGEASGSPLPALGAGRPKL
jgi:diaminopimelate epimerase